MALSSLTQGLINTFTGASSAKSVELNMRDLQKKHEEEMQYLEWKHKEDIKYLERKFGENKRDLEENIRDLARENEEVSRHLHWALKDGQSSRQMVAEGQERESSVRQQLFLLNFQIKMLRDDLAATNRDLQESQSNCQTLLQSSQENERVARQEVEALRARVEAQNSAFHSYQREADRAHQALSDQVQGLQKQLSDHLKTPRTNGGPGSTMVADSPQEEGLPSAGEMNFEWDTPRGSPSSPETVPAEQRVPAEQMSSTQELQNKSHGKPLGSMVPRETKQRHDNQAYVARPSSPSAEEKRILAEAQTNPPAPPPDDDDLDGDDGFKDEDL